MQNYLGYYYASLVVITIKTRYKYVLFSVQQNSFNAAIHVFLKIFKVTSCTIIYIYKYIYIYIKKKQIFKLCCNQIAASKIKFEWLIVSKTFIKVSYVF